MCHSIKICQTRGLPVAFISTLIMLVAVTIGQHPFGRYCVVDIATHRASNDGKIYSPIVFQYNCGIYNRSFVGSVAGLLLSYTLNVPSGAFIIFVLIFIFLMAKLGSFLQRAVKVKS